MHMKPLMLLSALVLLGACASHNKRVSCEGHLQPINVPAPVAKAAKSAGLTPESPLTSSAGARSP
jgi:hypothetical protein